MPEFRIKPINGHTISGAYRNAKVVVHWVVQVFNHSIGSWIFLQSFYTEQRAKDYVEQLKKVIAEGDYSCLTLRS